MNKVFLNIDKIYPNLPLYHVAPVINKKAFHFTPQFTQIEKTNQANSIFIGYTNKSLDDIKFFEEQLNHEYILFFNDCRHYTKSIIDYSLPENDLDIHNLFYIHESFIDTNDI